MYIEAISAGLVIVIMAGCWWFLTWHSSAERPKKTATASSAAAKLASTPPRQHVDLIRSLSDDEFRDYFVGFMPPGRISHPAEAQCYADLAWRQSRPMPPFRARNQHLERHCHVKPERVCV